MNYHVKIVLLIFSLFFFSCSSKEKKEISTATLTESFNQETEDNKETVQDTPSSCFVYVYENDTLKQTLKLVFLSEKKEIDFNLTSENKLKKQKESIQGVAKRENGDLELDEDDEGNVYLVHEYIYDGDCWIAFRVNLECKDINLEAKATVRIKGGSKCNKQHPNCPFYSIGLLLKQ